MSLPANTATWSPANYQSATAANVAALSLAQVAAMQHPDWLTASAVAGFSAAQVAAIVTNWSTMNAVWINALSTAAVAGIPPSGIAQLSGPTLAALNGAHLAALTARQIGALTAGQIGVLSAAQVGSFTATQVAGLTASQVGALSQPQLVAIGMRLQSLPAAALAGLANANLPAIYRDLSATQLAKLSSTAASVVALANKDTTSLQTGLNAAGLLNDVKAVAATGASLFGYQGVLTVLDDLGAQIGSGGLTSAQLADLRTFTSDVGAVDGLSSYVYGELNDVVNGNPFNATWTNGAGKSSALGNLATGSTQTQFDELVQKWLLGGDNPDWSAGTATKLTPTPGLLFNTAGVAASDPSQGGIGDCYLIASMVEVALDQPGLIQSMFTDNGNGTYGVRFYAPNGSATYVTVSDALPSGDRVAGSPSGAQWVTLLEKAYIEYSAEFNGTANAWTAIAGGWDQALRAITGKTDTSYISAYTSSQSAWDNTVDKAVISALSAGQEVLYGSFINDTDSIGKSDLIADHMFAVVGYDKATGDFILRNPWGAAGGSTWNGQFEQSIDQLWGGTSGTTSDSGFVVTGGNSPAVSATATHAAAHLVQAIASSGNQGGSVVDLARDSLAASAAPYTMLVSAHA